MKTRSGSDKFARYVGEFSARGNQRKPRRTGKAAIVYRSAAWSMRKSWKRVSAGGAIRTSPGQSSPADSAA